MTHNNYWEQQSGDWFCSSGAFGGVVKVTVKDMFIISASSTDAQVHADYLAEDIYNGNKCFDQSITVQRIEYTDGKFRRRLTRMKNEEEPASRVQSQ